MPSFDVYRLTTSLPEPVLDAVAARLEARGGNPEFLRMLHAYVEAMDIDGAATVLDLGCGTGVAARVIAARPAFRGEVIGIDQSDRLVEMATALAAAEGLAARTRFLVGDSRSLDLPDGGFDAVVAHTLVSHVEDPLPVLAEMRRVVRPGGMVGVFDGDYASITFDQADANRGARDDEAIQRAIVTSPRVMRQMPRLLRQAGLTLVRAFPFVVADIGVADFWLSSIESFRRILPQSGGMDADAANAWADARLRDADDRVFFGACNYYAYVARRD